MNLVDPECAAIARSFSRRPSTSHAASGSARVDPSFRRSGDSFDLKTIREFSPGDDPRRIDWKLYCRSGRLAIKDYFALTEEGLCILLDISSSVLAFDQSPFSNEPAQTPSGWWRPSTAAPSEVSRIPEPEASASLRLAASLAWILAACGTPVDLLAGTDHIQAGLRPGRLAGKASSISSFLSNLHRGGPTDLRHCLLEARGRSAARSLLIISDFFDPAFQPGHARGRGLQGFSRHFFIRLLRPLSAATRGENELRIVDPESRAVLTTAVDALLARRESEAEARLAARLGGSGHWRLDAGGTRAPMYRSFMEAFRD